MFFDDAASAATLSRAVKAGELRRIARGLYTADTAMPAEDLVSQNRWAILARFIPDALIADRSAASSGTVVDGHLFVVSSERVRPLVLPGLTIVPRAGPGPLEDDPPWVEGLRVASPARTLVDNLARSHGRGGKVARTLSQGELDDWVARQSQVLESSRLNRLRDRAKEIAAAFGFPERLELIDGLVGTALHTRPARGRSRLLAARVDGLDWDPERIRRFDELVAALANLDSQDTPDTLPAPANDWATALPFYEAYFSNFIEGTEFTLEEAERIISTGDAPSDRPEDAHDILGTHRVVADPDDRAQIPGGPDQLIAALKRRHLMIMEGRPQVHPGEFKTLPNQAGSHIFVQPDQVEGTLVEGFSRLLGISTPFGRALYMMFLVSEVHPFQDGNGRVARVMMNAELTAAGESRIVIPIVWRNEYLQGLRLLSRDGRTDQYIRVMAHAWRFSATVPWEDPIAVRAVLEQTNALVDSTEAERSGRRLLLPGDRASDAS